MVLDDGELAQGARVSGAQQAIDGEPGALHGAMLTHSITRIARTGGAMLTTWPIDLAQMIGVETVAKLHDVGLAHLAGLARRITPRAHLTQRRDRGGLFRCGEWLEDTGPRDVSVALTVERGPGCGASARKQTERCTQGGSARGSKRERGTHGHDLQPCEGQEKPSSLGVTAPVSAHRCWRVR